MNQHCQGEVKIVHKTTAGVDDNAVQTKYKHMHTATDVHAYTPSERGVEAPDVIPKKRLAICWQSVLFHLFKVLNVKDWGILSPSTYTLKM